MKSHYFFSAYHEGLKISLPVQIFTEDLTEVETLPRRKVLNFLKEGFKELAIPYLEHIIYVWDDMGPEFHNVLIQLYLERVQSLMKQYLNSLPEGRSKRKLGSQYLMPLQSDMYMDSYTIWGILPLYITTKYLK